MSETLRAGAPVASAVPPGLINLEAFEALAGDGGGSTWVSTPPVRARPMCRYGPSADGGGLRPAGFNEAAPAATGPITAADGGVWLVDLPAGVVEVCRLPVNGAYQDRVVCDDQDRVVCDDQDHVVPDAFPDVVIDVAAILPPGSADRGTCL